jgi:trigger factor
MQVSVNKISSVLFELAVEVPVDTVKTEVERAYTTVSKRAHIKGFRPGKAPRNVIKQMFSQQVASDVVNNLVQTTLPKAIAEQNITPLNQPTVEVGQFAFDQVFGYKARFEVQPELTDVKFEGFEIERPFAEVDEADVVKELEALRVRHSSLKAPEPARAAKASDVATIDFTLTVDGKEIKDGGGQGVQLELGAGQALPEIDAVLLGASVGSNVTCTSKFGDAHPREDFRGKQGTFNIKFVELKEKVLPTLDDEFAKDVGSFQTLIELRADLHSKLEKNAKDQSDTALAEQIVLKLNESNPCEVPNSLVDAQARMMEQDFVMNLRRMGQRLTKENAEQLSSQLRADAEKKVRAGLVMATIAKTNEFRVTDEDFEKGLAELSTETGKNVAKLRVEYREKQKRDMLVGMILEDKILDFLEGKSKISDLKKGETPKLLQTVEAKA